MDKEADADWDQRNNGDRYAQALRKHGRRARKRMDLVLSKQFVPRFWETSDQRIAVVRLIRKRIELLKAHTGADSYQKDLLCQRAAFISVLLESVEVKAAEGEALDTSAYVQMLNGLNGLLKSLGLERRIKKVGDLKTYLEEKEEAQA